MADLKHSLISCADLWCRASGAPQSRLGKQVTQDANFFQRLNTPAASLNLSTLERFADWLAATGNWPEGLVPEEVNGFFHRVKGKPTPAPAATGQAGQLSGGGVSDQSPSVAEAGEVAATASPVEARA